MESSISVEFIGLSTLCCYPCNKKPVAAAKVISRIYHLNLLLGKTNQVSSVAHRQSAGKTNKSSDLALQHPAPGFRNLSSIVRKSRGSRRNNTRMAVDAKTAGHGWKTALITTWLSSPHRALITVWLLFTAHASGLLVLFQPTVGLIDSHPLLDQDWGLHFHHLRSMEAFWRQDKTLWGYNPFFMSGYPSNTIQDLSIKFFEFLALGLSAVALSPIQWFKLCAFFAMASVPWLMYFSARNFFFADESKHLMALAAAFLGTIYWWNSLPREMFFYGMIGFPIASYLGILGASLFYRLAGDPANSVWVYAGWLLFATVILPLHVQSVVIFLPPMIALLASQPRLLTPRILLWIGAAGVLSVVVNSPWLIAAIQHRSDDVGAAIVEQLPLFASTHPFTFFLDYLGPPGYWTFRPSFIEKGFRLSLLLLGVVGTWKLIQSDRRALGIMLASALTVLLLLAYFGALLPVFKAWQPLRFKVPFDLFLIIGAAYCTGRRTVAPAAARSRLAPLLLAGGLIAFVINLVQTESTGKLRLRSRIIPELSALVDWIERDTPPDARVLFEESGDETGFVYDGIYLSSFLPHLTGRQLIGGPINLYNDRHHFAEFHSGQMFKKDVQTLTDIELRNYLRLYNIGAVVVFHPASIQRLQAIPGLVTVEQRIGPVHLMKVHQPLSWFIEGVGKIKAGLNRLEISELKGNEVVLKYHWVEGLTASPPTKVEPVKMLDDPIPFIKLVAPPSSVSLRIGSSD
jgi:hypothetical protein